MIVNAVWRLWNADAGCAEALCHKRQVWAQKKGMRKWRSLASVPQVASRLIPPKTRRVDCSASSFTRHINRIGNHVQAEGAAVSVDRGVGSVMMRVDGVRQTVARRGADTTYYPPSVLPRQ